jgi:hypothetical protein
VVPGLGPRAIVSGMRLACSALALFLVSTVLAGEPQDTIRHFHREFGAAMTKGAFPTVKKIVLAYVAADFVRAEGKNIRQSRDDLIRQVTLSSPRAHITSFIYNLGKINVQPYLAVVTSTAKVKVDTKDAAGKVHKIVATSVDLETWVRTPAGWKLRSMAALKESTTIDGKKPQGMTRAGG